LLSEAGAVVACRCQGGLSFDPRTCPVMMEGRPLPGDAAGILAAPEGLANQRAAMLSLASCPAGGEAGVFNL